jgi:type IV pilus assembly protein PilY1
MKTRTIRNALLVLLVAAVLPLDTDAGQAECCTGNSSLASTAVGPVTGDEAFFKLPSGPSNIMVLLDVSGSMGEFTQCGDSAWDDNGAPATCTSPKLTAPTDSTNAAVTFTYTGTCTPASAAPFNASLAWMEAVVPTRNLPDPGRSNSLLTDKAPWGTGCVGDACLFDPDGYFSYGDWRTSTSGSSSTRRASDVDAALPKGCTAFDSSGAVVRDFNGANIVLGADCTKCMADHGYFFYSLSAYNRKSSGGTPNRWSYTSNVMFKGTFLNASPPKFVTARKAVKDVAFMDPASPSKLDQVRLGLTVLNAGQASPQKADLIVPLGPDKTGSYPPTQAGFVQSRQYILSVLNYDQTVYKNALGATICDGATITGGFFDPASTSTPIASALFNIGQYFSSLNRYNALLGTGYQTSAFNESSGGLVKAPWANANPNQCSICWACQNNGVLIVTDGAPNSEITFPNTISNYDSATYNAAANCGANGASCGKSPVPRVADWLHNSDLRDNAVMSGKQAITVYTVGINLTNATAVSILRATSNLSGGAFQNATDPATLSAAIFNAVNSVAPKENSFSAASASSLQTVQTAASQAFLTRFKPSQNVTWEGHALQAYLFDEFLNGCDPSLAVQPTVTCKGQAVSADFNGDGQCNGVFLIDKDCDEISEDTNGDFVKKGQAAYANLTWDAGLVLSDPTKIGYRSADETATNARNIFTYVSGAKVAFTAANAATIQPLLNIDAAWCTAFLTRIGVPGGATPTLTCAQQLIYFVRGWDVLNQDSDKCAGPGNPMNTAACKSGTKGEERDRANDGSATPFFWKLGDIFHSSPATLQVPADEVRCDTGYDKQCVATLHSPAALPNQVSNPLAYTDATGNRVDAYAKYRLNNLTRKRLLLVGANDGMLHAFDAGALDLTATPDLTGDYPYTDGTGEELWAFIPPDLLPRLKGLVDNHQYMVDGSVMLRDVWVDGSGTQVTGKDFRKESDEFHTVAIVGRRSGGNVYSALDVTDALNPKLLWNFPEGCSDDARYMGETWADFSPRPPPIVPVKIANPASPLLDASTGVKFEERWVVMLNGGYDPMLTQGRAVFFVDVWTGKTLWRFTDDDFKAQLGYTGGTSMFPVAAGIGPVDIGDTTKQVQDVDGFFDTATWGDLGGNLWVARFQAPGTLDPTTGQVTNWWAARAFEQRRQVDDSQHAAARNEFFFMTANAYDATSKTLRSYLGSGNREQIMSQASTCGTDNLLGCAQAGCTKVTSSTAQGFGACDRTTTFSVVNDVMSYATTASATCGTTAATCAAAPGNASTLNVAAHMECPGSPATVTDVSGKSSCDASGLCTVTPMPATSATGTFATPSHKRFYGIWAYGGDPKKMFADKTTAKVFDQNRFTDAPFGGSCSMTTGGTCALIDTTTARVTSTTTNPLLASTSCATGVTRCAATARDAGWFYEYGDVCPLASCSPAPPWTDEKTGSGATVTIGCTSWGSFRPVGAITSVDPCSGSLGVPASYAYTAHYVTGTPNPTACGTAVSAGAALLATQRSLTSPPTSPMQRITMSPPGPGPGPGPPPPPPPPGTPNTNPCGAAGGRQIRYSTLSMDAGSAPTNSAIGTKCDAAEPIYWMEVPRDLHACRHTTATGACE